MFIKARFRRIFLHFFDIHFLESKGMKNQSPVMRDKLKFECRLATRFAILAADEILVPAASFFESEICFDILSELEDLYQFGVIKLVGGGGNLKEFSEQKLTQYLKKSLQYRKYSSLKTNAFAHPPFFSRQQSASRDITAGWQFFLNDGHLGKIVEGSSLHLPKGIEKAWASVPDRLEKKAFIVDHVEPLLIKSPCPGTIRNRLLGIINEYYYNSFTRELCAGVINDLNYLEANHPVPSYDTDLPYKAVLNEMRRRELIDLISKAKAQELLKIRENPKWQAGLDAACTKYDIHRAHAQTSYDLMVMKELDTAKIGIITALPEEFAAVCSVFDGKELISATGKGAGRKYSIARIKGRSGVTQVIAICLVADIGNNSAAFRAAQMFFHCKNLDHVIMTGIAGGVPDSEKAENHVRLGDIVVSNRFGIIQYDNIKQESATEVKDRHPPRPPAAVFLEGMNHLESEEFLGKNPWNEYIDRTNHRLGSLWDRPSEKTDILRDYPDQPINAHPVDPKRRLGVPRIFRGAIASANILLKDPVKRNMLRDKFGVKAIEMEGSGVADASWANEKGYVVIRGVCDYCNSFKNDVWHQYAALAAAAYTRALVEII